MDSQPQTLSLSAVVHGIAVASRTIWSFLPLPLAKAGPLGRSGDIVERVFESVAALPGKVIVVAATDNGTNNMTKE